LFSSPPLPPSLILWPASHLTPPLFAASWRSLCFFFFPPRFKTGWTAVPTLLLFPFLFIFCLLRSCGKSRTHASLCFSSTRPPLSVVFFFFFVVRSGGSSTHFFCFAYRFPSLGCGSTDILPLGRLYLIPHFVSAFPPFFFSFVLFAGRPASASCPSCYPFPPTFLFPGEPGLGKCRQDVGASVGGQRVFFFPLLGAGLMYCFVFFSPPSVRAASPFVMSWPDQLIAGTFVFPPFFACPRAAVVCSCCPPPPVSLAPDNPTFSPPMSVFFFVLLVCLFVWVCPWQSPQFPSPFAHLRFHGA